MRYRCQETSNYAIHSARGIPSRFGLGQIRRMKFTISVGGSMSGVFVSGLRGFGYDLEIGRRGGATSFVAWRISPVDSQHCTLSITVYPHVLQKVPVVIRWLPHLLRVRPMLTSYLESVVKGFEWYVTRGEPVPRDRFGKHPWFSASESTAG